MEAINACPHHGFDTWLLGWDEPTKGEVGKMKSQLSAYNAKAGMYTLKEDDDMKAKMAAMTRRLEELELKKYMKCKLLRKHQVQVKCPNNNAPYGNTYNSSWRNHPNFSWKARATQYQQPDPPSQQSSSLEQAIANLSKWKAKRRIITVKDVKALITLRSGKKIEKPTPEPHVENEEEIKKGKEMEDKESEISEEKKDSDSTMNPIPRRSLKEEM
ncbi:hypothetical protein AAG906_037902 [Vitis piasezkii]